MTNAELIAKVRELAKGMEFDTRWLVLELAARLERQRPKGEWEIILDDYDCEFMRCSLCGEEFYDANEDTIDRTPNFCPNCGADMRGDSE